MSEHDPAIPEQFSYRIAGKSGSEEGPALDVEFSVLKQPNAQRSRVAVFAIVRNESYFLPHFLRHYRDLGLREFWFLDDRSTDGTREMLLGEPDCGVIVSNLTFGDRVLHLRFGEIVKTLVPHKLFQGRWLLIVDADEFLLLPAVHRNLDDVVGALDDAGLKVARAVMMDFFPRTLREIEEAPADRGPLELCPYFDAWQTLDWRDRELAPRALSLRDSVRPRMLARLVETSRDLGDWVQSYRFAVMSKVPLLFWESDTEMLSAHHSSARPSDAIQLALAHFKFYPGYAAKIADALSRKAYWQESVEYQFLDVAARMLPDWPLAGPRTHRYHSPKDVEETGSLYSRLAPTRRV